VGVGTAAHAAPLREQVSCPAYECRDHRARWAVAGGRRLAARQGRSWSGKQVAETRDSIAVVPRRSLFATLRAVRLGWQGAIVAVMRWCPSGVAVLRLNCDAGLGFGAGGRAWHRRGAADQVDVLGDCSRAPVAALPVTRSVPRR